MTEEQAAWYLAAMIDGEGWIGDVDTKIGPTPRNRAVRINNCDEALIRAVERCCDVLGMHYTKRRQDGRREGWNDQYAIEITGAESMRRLLAVVPIQSPKKLDRLRRMIETYKPEIDIDELRRIYEGGATAQETADTLGVGVKRIRSAMKAHGIPRRQGAERAAVIWRIRKEKQRNGG
jgi:hypothetical protein